MNACCQVTVQLRAGGTLYAGFPGNEFSRVPCVCAFLGLGLVIYRGKRRWPRGAHKHVVLHFKKHLCRHTLVSIAIPGCLKQQ